MLDVILDAVLIEAQADVATLMLEDPRSGLFVERSRKLSVQVDDGFTGELNLGEVLEHYRADRRCSRTA